MLKLKFNFLKDLLANQSQILCGPSSERLNESYINDTGHMAKMAA